MKHNKSTKQNKPKNRAKEVSVSLVKSTTQRAPAPKVRGRGDLPISHREMVLDVSTADLEAGTLNLSGFAVNPGNHELFPWLSQESKGYQNYSFGSLRFEWVGGCPATTPGTIIMGFDYDPDEPAPTSELALSNYVGATQGEVWNSHTCNVNLKLVKSGRNKYVAIAPVFEDLPFYYTGSFFIAFPFCPVPAEPIKLGKLYVSYAVNLSVPQMAPDSDDSWFGRDVITRTGYQYQATSDAGAVTLDPLGYLDLEEEMTKKNWVYVPFDDRFTVSNKTWPAQYYQNITAHQSGSERFWSAGCQALTDLKIHLKIGCENQQNVTTATTGSRAAYFLSEAAVYDEELLNLVTDTESYQQSGGYVTTADASVMTAMSDAADTIDYEFTLRAGEWLVWHTTAMPLGAAEDITAKVANPTADQPTKWWEVLLDFIPIVGTVVKEIASIFLLPASVQLKLRKQATEIHARTLERLASGKLKFGLTSGEPRRDTYLVNFFNERDSAIHPNAASSTIKCKCKVTHEHQ